MDNDQWTVGKLLGWTADYLRQHGAENPRLDAEILLAEARACDRISLYMQFEEIPPDEQRARFRELVKQRAVGTPVAYLVGHREFFSLPFLVTPEVLIPRPETELLVIQLLDLAKALSPQDEPLRVADVGTGSGIIAICAARHLSAAKVLALDISSAALRVARKNAQDLAVDSRIDFIAGDLLAPVGDACKFHIIASNPPYVAAHEMGTLSRDVRDFEPHTALCAGERGTEVMEHLIPQAAVRLEPQGWLILEISPMIEQAVVELIARESSLQLGPRSKDLAGQPRVVTAQKTP